MEIPKINIPQIQIKEIYIPKIRSWEIYPTTLDIIDKPNLAWPVLDVPTLKPLEYNPDKFTPVEPEKPFTANDPIVPEFPEVKIPPKKEKEFFVKCPNETNLRIGNYANELKLEKVIGHKLSEDGRICYEIFALSTFREKWIPSTPLLVNTSIIAITAASSPLIANAVKALIKNIIKRLKSKGTRTSKQD